MQEILVMEPDDKIPENYKYDTETKDFFVYRHMYNGDEIHIAKKPPLYIKAIMVPENATNLDMLKAVFPDDLWLHLYARRAKNDWINKKFEHKSLNFSQTTDADLIPIDHDRMLNDDIVQIIKHIFEQFDYTVTVKNDYDNNYDFDCIHNKNERLNFNAYGCSLLEIMDAIYWHCENGKENKEPIRLTALEANQIKKINVKLAEHLREL